MGALRIGLALALLLALLYHYKARKRRAALFQDLRPALAEGSERTKSVATVHYEVRLRLQEELYKGSVRCSFVMRRQGELRLDFQGKTITDFRVNHQRREPQWTSPTSISLSPLKLGFNEVEIRFLGLYSDTGLSSSPDLVLFPGAVQGLHRVFPCFDQPDIKATCRLIVSALRGWEVLSTDFPQRLTNYVGCCPDPDPIFDEEERQPSTLHEFHPSVPYSPDHFAVCAGQFTRFTLQKQQRLTVLCRPQLAPSLNLSLHFTTLEQALSHMHELTGVPYCFPKLDVVYVPRTTGYAASVVFVNEELGRIDWGGEEELRETLARQVAAQWVGVLLTYESSADQPAWSSLRDVLADDFLGRECLDEARRAVLQARFSLHKWDSCAAATLYS